MPVTFKRLFRVRHHECDAHGRVHHANYVRYMQEAAFDASAALGYDLARYAAMGRMWLIRETEVEYLRPLHYGDVVEVETWVADIRRVRSRRDYVARCPAAGEVVARGHTDWVFMDTHTAQPASVPEEMTVVLVEQGVALPQPRRERFPDPGPPPVDAYRQRRCVEWCDVDSVGHVNNAVYVAYAEDAAVRWAMTGASDHEPLAVRQHRIEYLLPALLGDELEVIAWLTGATRHTEVVRAGDGARLARVRTEMAWGDGSNEPSHPDGHDGG